VVEAASWLHVQLCEEKMIGWDERKGYGPFLVERADAHVRAEQ
jgi:hypothetical protein